MGTLTPSLDELDEPKCYIGPFGRLLPVEAERPTWLHESSPSRTPRRRARYSPKSEPPKKPTALQFGSDTSLGRIPGDESSEEETSSPVPADTVEHVESSRPRKRKVVSQLPTPTSCYASSLSDWSSGSSRTASPDGVTSGHGRPLTSDAVGPPTSVPYLAQKELEFPLPYPEPTIASDEPVDLSMGLYMGDTESEGALSPQMDFDFDSFDYAKLGIFPPEYVEPPPGHYHQSRLPYIPDLASTQVPAPLSIEMSGEDNSLQDIAPGVPQQRQLVYVVEERVVEGEGVCYIYSDGSHCPKYRNGELVNANWGVTKAGKPRKRLAQACLTCRSKKIKCIPNLPKCDQCRRSGRNCRYENA